ncbi:MAG: helix-turn-helix domain-containing protein [Bacteroidales bacterium]|nr:helix-turn-helix domain-containing protein [Bacteroidales bacterium]
MNTLKYKLIKSEEQYYEYCRILKRHVIDEHEENEDEIELLELLIDKWDQDHNTMEDVDPVELLKYLMEDHKLKAKDLAEILGLSKGTVSKILNYQKGFSKATIIKLSSHFKLYQEAFNRPYPLVGQVSKELRSAS